MKKTFIFLLLLTVSFRLTAQNAYYDAKELAAFSAADIDLLARMPGDPQQFSDEELQTIRQATLFFKDPFGPGIDRSILDTRLLRSIVTKLAAQQNKALLTIRTNGGGSAFFGSTAPTGNPMFAGLGSTVSRLGSADFQTTLIDATGKYLAQSFKEDMTYLYFSSFRDKLDSNPFCKYLIPQTAGVLKMMDPFKFKNLGDSWKVAFEKDLQQMPVSFISYIKNNTDNAWSRRVAASDYFKYYGYSVDVLQPLVAGQHPVEVLETVDKNYHPGPWTGLEQDNYKSFIHLVNILQFNLQDSSKRATDKQYENLWLSFGQLKGLNTALKRRYFFALIYQQDPSFFRFDPLGKEVAKSLQTANGYNDILASLSKLLVLFNQVEGQIKTITAARQSGGSIAASAPGYLSSAIAMLDSTNAVLKGMSRFSNNATLMSFSKKIDLVVHYGKDAYHLYSDICAKNYPGVIDDASALLQAIDQKDRVSIAAVSSELSNAVTYTFRLTQVFNAMQTELKDLKTMAGQPVALPNDKADLAPLILNALNSFGQQDQEQLSAAFRQLVQYDQLPPLLRQQVDQGITKLMPDILKLQQVIQNTSGDFDTYQRVYQTYLEASQNIKTFQQLDETLLAKAMVDNTDQFTGTVDVAGFKTFIQTKLGYNAMDAANKAKVNPFIAAMTDDNSAFIQSLQDISQRYQLSFTHFATAYRTKFGPLSVPMWSDADLLNLVKNHYDNNGAQDEDLIITAIKTKIGYDNLSSAIRTKVDLALKDIRPEVTAVNQVFPKLGKDLASYQTAGIQTYQNVYDRLNNLKTLTLPELVQIIVANINASNGQIDATAIKGAIKAAVGYSTLPDAVQKDFDLLLTRLDGPLDQLSAASQKAFNKYKPRYDDIMTYYNNAVKDIPSIPTFDDAKLIALVTDHIVQQTLDEDAFRAAVMEAIGYNKLEPKYKLQLDTMLPKWKDAITQLNKELQGFDRSSHLSDFLQTISIINKYGQVIAGVANAQNSDELEAVIKKFVAPSGSYVAQRTSATTISIAAKVGAYPVGFEGKDNWQHFSYNAGLTAPLGFEFTWAHETDKPTKTGWIDENGKRHYLSGTSSNLFIQVFDIAAVVNYRLSSDSSSSSLPQKILLSQVFSPGLSYSLGLRNLPFDIGLGAAYTPQLRKIGSDPQANAIRIFLRIAWNKPLIFLSNRPRPNNTVQINNNL